MQHENQNPTNDADPKANETAPECDTDNQNCQQPPELTEEEIQAEYRRRHLEQMRRFQCPGCGETDIF